MSLRKGQFKSASTHVACRVRIHVGVGQRCRAIDVESPALPASPVRIHVGVGQRCRAMDVESPALPAASARSASIGAIERYMHGFNSAQSSRSPATNAPQTVSIPSGRRMEVQGRFKMQAPTPAICAHTRQHTGNSAGDGWKFRETSRCKHT